MLLRQGSQRRQSWDCCKLGKLAALLRPRPLLRTQAAGSAPSTAGQAAGLGPQGWPAWQHSQAAGLRLQLKPHCCRCCRLRAALECDCACHPCPMLAAVLCWEQGGSVLGCGWQGHAPSLAPLLLPTPQCPPLSCSSYQMTEPAACGRHGMRSLVDAARPCPLCCCPRHRPPPPHWHRHGCEWGSAEAAVSLDVSSCRLHMHQEWLGKGG